MTEQTCTNVRARIRSMFSILKGGLSFMIHLKMENLYLSTAKILVKTLNSFGLWILYILGLQTHTFGVGVLCPVNFFTSRLSSVQFSSVAQSCPTIFDPMDCSTPGLPVHHQLPEFTQTHLHWVGDAIQPSHPLLSSSPPAFNLSHHQGLFKWISSSHQVAKVLKFQLQD